MSEYAIAMIVAAIPAVVWIIPYIDSPKDLPDRKLSPKEMEEFQLKLSRAFKRMRVYNAIIVVTVVISIVWLILLYKPIVYNYLFG